MKLLNKKAFVPIVQLVPNSVNDEDDYSVKLVDTENI